MDAGGALPVLFTRFQPSLFGRREKQEKHQEKNLTASHPQITPFSC
jgi:hypothetical protein